ncbi:D-alanine--D-alanine ligase family protein [Chloroflexus sp.]|uniref:D-alanine--D-alanine ligase family protein n=1 Tax=Chloroflexus sp. TaxID=1904827 RepID=UPI002637D1D6|nr:D-alanine--D-alanine ligase family protein [uncultured Chloroflexus sp.]
MSRPITIAVIFGGQSGEHEVSLVSAHAVMSNLDPARYQIEPIGIGKDGRWWHGPGALAALMESADPDRLPTSATMATPGPVRELGRVGTPGWMLPPVDVIFPVLHGPYGEDGAIQGLFELAGIPYVGCGVAASAVGMDKGLMKAAFAAAGLPVLPWLLVRRHELAAVETVCEWIEATLHFPIFVKPANLGSSVGVSKARDRAELIAGLREAARYDRRIIVEQGIPAREIEISVLGNDQIAVSLPGEIIPAGEWYDYHAKYIDGGSQAVVPAALSSEQVAQVQALAAQAFQAIDGAGLARVDFLLDRDQGTLWLNEVNTMPGFTPISMYAKMWAASGLAYPQLLDRLVELALERATHGWGNKG